MKYIIEWDAGGGTCNAEVDADSQEEAEAMAEEAWLGDVMDSGNFAAHKVEE